MKHKNQSLNIVTTILLLVLAFLSVVNITYSYFTATNKVEGNMAFGNLDARFYYTTSTGTFVKDGVTTIDLFSATGTIARGQEFELSVTKGGDPIETLGIEVDSGSIETYVRFWIDAYLVKDDGTLDKTTNYGKFFLFDSNNRTITNTGGTVSTSTCYFGIDYIDEDYPLEIGNTLTFSDLEDETIPVELLGEEFQLTISFEAVQRANNGFKHAFGAPDDMKGYYADWSSED